MWYLPFFVAKQDKPKVVYGGAATVAGVSLIQAVLAGTNLLNNLVEVLTRFRLNKFAAMAVFLPGRVAQEAKGSVQNHLVQE